MIHDDGLMGNWGGWDVKAGQGDARYARAARIERRGRCGALRRPPLQTSNLLILLIRKQVNGDNFVGVTLHLLTS